MILRTLAHTIRYTLTGLLLWQVFTHAHWSVGLCLTLWVVRYEVEDLVAAWKRERESIQPGWSKPAAAHVAQMLAQIDRRSRG